MLQKSGSQITETRVFGVILWLMALRNVNWIVDALTHPGGGTLLGGVLSVLFYGAMGWAFFFRKTDAIQPATVGFFTSPAFFLLATILIVPITLLVDMIFVEDSDSGVAMVIPFLGGIIALGGVAMNALRIKRLNRRELVWLFILCFLASWGVSFMLRFVFKLVRHLFA